MLGLYRNPDLDEQIYDCLFMPCRLRMCMHPSCMWGDLKVHDHLFGSNTMNRLAVTAFDFSTVSGCELVVGPTHGRDGTLDLMMTDVPETVQIAVFAPIDYSISTLITVSGHFDGTCCLELVCQ